jgi:serine/threonine protein kinase
MASVEVLAPGSVFAGRFRIVELLGEGETGAAYLVGVLPEKKRCVLKAMAAELVKQDALRRLFEGYAKSTSKVASANVLQTLDAGIDRASGRPWFTTDLLRGEDLAVRVAREGAQPLPDVRLLLAALGDALGKAHAQGLVHYDLTPENIHLGQGRPLAVKLRELTISRLVSDAVAAEGEVVGTAIWLPPEQFDLGRRLTPAANVWSLALLAFYAATGRPYWMNASDDPSPSKDLLREILAGPIVSASERAKALGCTSGLPPWFDGWFARCVTREPGKRLPDAHAAHALLAESLDHHYALADDVDDDQRTTLRLPDRPARPKGSRSLPRGILAEAKGGSTFGATPPPSGVAGVGHRGAKQRGSSRWPYLTLLSAPAVLLLWFLLSSDRNQWTSSPGNAAGSDSTGKPLRSPPPTSARSESAEAGVTSTAAALGSATSDAPAPGGAVVVRTLAAGDGQGGTADFDLAGALKVLNGVYYGNCAVPSEGKLAITFAPSGRAKRVAVLRGDYDEATTACITARFGAARMSPFRGGEQSVTADIVPTR